MTHYSRTLTSEAHYDDRSCARPLFRPAFWFRIAVADPGGGGVTGMITPPPLNFPDTENAMSKGGGGACECPSPRVGVFFNFSEGGWRHADNVQGGWGACECLHPPLQEILYPRLDLDRDPPPQKKKLYPISPTGGDHPCHPPPPPLDPPLHLRSTSKKGGCPTLGPMLKCLHRGPKGGGGPDPLDPPGSASGILFGMDWHSR